MQNSWAGIFPAVTTKFKADFSLDIAAMEKHFSAQIKAGVHGLIVVGSLGENGTLTAEEKLIVMETALRVAKNRVPVLAGVAESTTAEACHFVEHAEKRGADGYMVMPPMRYVSDTRETLTWFRSIAAATSRNIMIYNNPVSYGVDVTPAMFAELADEKKFVAIKESSDDVRRVTQIINVTGNRYQIFCGVDNLALEALHMGATGWVAGLVDAFPQETVAIYECFRSGELHQAREIYRWFQPLLDLDVSSKLVQNIKLAESLTGLGTETVRPPRLPLTGKEREKVIKIIEAALGTRPRLQAA